MTINYKLDDLRIHADSVRASVDTLARKAQFESCPHEVTQAIADAEAQLEKAIVALDKARR